MNFIQILFFSHTIDVGFTSDKMGVRRLGFGGGFVLGFVFFLLLFLDRQSFVNFVMAVH